jgi:hypothetical protein
MEVPEPEVAPAIPAPFVAAQEKVAPVVKLLRATDVVAPEQIVEVTGVAVTKGTGLTVMVTGIGVPGQPAELGTIE